MFNQLFGHLPALPSWHIKSVTTSSSNSSDHCSYISTTNNILTKEKKTLDPRVSVAKVGGGEGKHLSVSPSHTSIQHLGHFLLCQVCSSTARAVSSIPSCCVTDQERGSPSYSQFFVIIQLRRCFSNPPLPYEHSSSCVSSHPFLLWPF